MFYDCQISHTKLGDFIVHICCTVVVHDC